MTPPPVIQIDEMRPLLIRWMGLEAGEEWEKAPPIELEDEDEN